MERDWEALAKLFGKSARSVKRWAAEGAPVDQAEEMAGWWDLNMKQRCPPALLRLAKVELELPKFVPPPPKPVEDGELGIEATLRRLQEAEVKTHREYEAAVIQGQDGKAATAKKHFMDLASKVALIEEKAIAQREKVRDLIPRIPAEMAIADFHQDFHGLLRGSAPRFFRAFGIVDNGENEALWHGMMDEICQALQREVFNDGEG